MTLSEKQIDRYSRQIIVPELGGAAQERLLHAAIVLCGEAADLELPLYYIAGAGVGRILLKDTDASPDRLSAIINHARGLNADIRVESAHLSPPQTDLAIAVAGSPDTLAWALENLTKCSCAATIIARLDRPPKIAITKSLAHASAPIVELLGRPFDGRVAAHRFVSTILATEALILLKSEVTAVPTRLIEFDGRATRLVTKTPV